MPTGAEPVPAQHPACLNTPLTASQVREVCAETRDARSASQTKLRVCMGGCGYIMANIIFVTHDDLPSYEQSFRIFVHDKGVQ